MLNMYFCKTQLINKYNFTLNIFGNNSFWNFFFYILLFILIWFIYNIIINNIIKINLFNKKNLFFIVKKRQLCETFLKFLKNNSFILFYKKIIFNKLV